MSSGTLLTYVCRLMGEQSKESCINNLSDEQTAWISPGPEIRGWWAGGVDKLISKPGSKEEAGHDFIYPGSEICVRLHHGPRSTSSTATKTESKDGEGSLVWIENKPAGRRTGNENVQALWRTS